MDFDLGLVSFHISLFLSNALYYFFKFSIFSSIALFSCNLFLFFFFFPSLPLRWLSASGLLFMQIDRPLQRHGGRLGHNEEYCGSCFGGEMVYWCLVLLILSFHMETLKIIAQVFVQMCEYETKEFLAFFWLYRKSVI